MAGGHVYLVNYPTGQHAHVKYGATAVNGEEFPPGWIVTRVSVADAEQYTEDGLLVSFQVWVEPKPPDVPGIELETR